MAAGQETTHGSDEYWRNWIRQEMDQSAELKSRTAQTCSAAVLKSAMLVADCFRAGGKLLICGNGGSAADAQHLAAEFVNRLNSDLPRPGLPAISLTTDTSFLTSFANDVGYDGIFERQVSTLGKPNDVLVAITTSGNSQNILKAVDAARRQKMITIGLTGKGGALAELVDQAIVVPSQNTQHVQECFLSIEHIICGVVEQILFGTSQTMTG